MSRTTQPDFVSFIGSLVTRDLISSREKYAENRAFKQIEPAAGAEHHRNHAALGSRPWLFGVRGPGFGKWHAGKVALDERSGVSDWRLHDCRRLVSTTLHERLNIAPHIV